jgi:hypothetical protein
MFGAGQGLQNKNSGVSSMEETRCLVRCFACLHTAERGLINHVLPFA